MAVIAQVVFLNLSNDQMPQTHYIVLFKKNHALVMKNFICISIFVLLHLNINLSAQKPNGPTNLQSPNVASLGLYGEIPVSHYTGTPSIEIPLYTIKARDYNLPIFLSYHSSGVRPDQHPGWVGLGWSLNAGGVIYRTVNDMPDDYDNPNYYMGGKSGL